MTRRPLKPTQWPSRLPIYGKVSVGSLVSSYRGNIKRQRASGLLLLPSSTLVIRGNLLVRPAGRDECMNDHHVRRPDRPTVVCSLYGWDVLESSVWCAFLVTARDRRIRRLDGRLLPGPSANVLPRTARTSARSHSCRIISHGKSSLLCRRGSYLPSCARAVC